MESYLLWCVGSALCRQLAVVDSPLTLGVYACSEQPSLNDIAKYNPNIGVKYSVPLMTHRSDQYIKPSKNKNAIHAVALLRGKMYCGARLNSCTAVLEIALQHLYYLTNTAYVENGDKVHQEGAHLFVIRGETARSCRAICHGELL